MAQRPIWRGHIRLALVSCPVALYNAHHERNTLRFSMINPKTGNRVRMLTVDAETKEEISRGDTVKGYEFRKDHYLILTEEDFESVRVPSSTTMNIDKFVPEDSLDPIYFDASYYLAPDGAQGEDVYAVVRDAIISSGKLALSHVVIGRRERVVAIVPMGAGLVAHTLHEERDLNSSADLFDRVPKTKSDPEMVKLATQLIDRQAGTYNPTDVEDRYEVRLRALIDAKLKGEGLTAEPEAEPDRSNVVDLMTALKKSLSEAQKMEPAAAAEEAPAKPRASRKTKPPTPEEMRRQPAFKLPIEGGQKGKAADRHKEAVEPEAGRSAQSRRKA